MGHNHSNGHPDKDLVGLIGDPGAGKGELGGKLNAAFMEQGLNVSDVEVGQIVRGHLKGGTDLGKQMKDYTEKGLMVPDTLIVPGVRDAIMAIPRSHVLKLDGFPRTKSQIKDYEKVIEDTGRNDVFLHLLLDTDPKVREEIAVERILSRGKLAGDKARKDDLDPAVIRQRLKVADEELKPVIDTLGEAGKIIRINAKASKQEVEREAREKLFAVMFAGRNGHSKNGNGTNGHGTNGMHA